MGHGSGSQVKRVVTTPPGFLMSYFDISGAEVRCIAYLSKDKFMLGNYMTPRNADDYQNSGPDDPDVWKTKGKDPYIQAAMVLKPGESMDYYKKFRGTYKTSLLGGIYGMGPKALAERIGCSPDEANVAYNDLFSLIPEVDQYIKMKSQYPIDHHGKVETVLGQRLSILSEPSDRWTRLGINLVIQGHAAITLADGFESNIRNSYNTKECTVRPLNVVHDSKMTAALGSNTQMIINLYAGSLLRAKI